MKYCLIQQKNNSFNFILKSDDKAELEGIKELYQQEADLDREWANTSSEVQRSRKVRMAESGTMTLGYEVERVADVMLAPGDIDGENEITYHVVPAEPLMPDTGKIEEAFNIDSSLVLNLIETEKLLTVN